jgi:hypothetical protein
LSNSHCIGSCVLTRKQAVKLCLVGIVGIIGNSAVKLCQVFADSNHYSQKPVITILWARDSGNLRSLRELQGFVAGDG